MCGITGIFSLNSQPIQHAQKRINRMTMMLKHRGPDGQGTYVSPDGGFALGNTRLAIVDPLCKIKQPLETRDNKAVLSFNGEIYNYLEIREYLEQKGISFRTGMDTEVLLEGLYLEGENILERLDGMWAFAYYDTRDKILLLSRDVLGERHIFYRVDRANGELIFASEIKPILADTDKIFNFDFEALITSLRFFSAPPGQTLIKEIKRILPGHNIKATLDNDFKSYRYRKLHPEKYFEFFNNDPSIDEVIDVYKKSFNKTCKRRLPLDVPFISTLSGGLDSAIICMFASDFGKKRIRTLYGHSSDEHARNHGDELDEYSASKFTSNKFNTRHTRIDMNSIDCVSALERAASNGFDGVIDDAVASYEMLARKVRDEKINVILISDGPDDVLGGYPQDKHAYLLDLKRHKKPIISSKSFRFEPIHEVFNPDILRSILPDDLILGTSGYYGVIDVAYNDILQHLDYSQKCALSYASTSLPDHFNLRTDKAFLGVSVECRLPHQAPEMIELMIAMPAFLRFNKGETTKFLIRKIVEEHIGPEIANRSKHGFSAPLFRTPKVYDALNFEETLRESSLFKDFPFKPGAAEIISLSEYEKLTWPLFALAKTYECIKNCTYT